MSRKLRKLYRLYNGRNDDWLSFETRQEVEFYLLDNDLVLVHYTEDWTAGKYENILVTVFYAA